MRDVETRIRIGDSQRSYYKVPDHRAALRANTAAAWADPEKRARMGRPRAHLDALSEQQRADYKTMQRRGMTVPDILKRLGVAVT